jgi:hypothetical protein
VNNWVLTAVSIVVIACLTTRLLAAAPPAAPSGAPEATAEQWQTWWEDLEKGEPDASRALLNFAMRPEQAVAFLKEHLVPLSISEDDVKKLIADLNSDDEGVWKPAFEKLEYLDPRLAIGLETLMDTVLEPLARTRLTEILSDRPAESLRGKGITLRKVGAEGHNFFDGHGSWWAEQHVEKINSRGWGNTKKKWTRGVRGVVLLELIGNTDAVALLKTMAQGHADAEVTKVAQEAMDNLDKR